MFININRNGNSGCGACSCVVLLITLSVIGCAVLGMIGQATGH